MRGALLAPRRWHDDAERVGKLGLGGVLPGAEAKRVVLSLLAALLGLGIGLVLAMRVTALSDAEGKVAARYQYAAFGASPRGAQALILAAKFQALLDGRWNVSFGDIRAVAKPSLRHRILLNFEGEADGIKTCEIVDNILDEVPTTIKGESLQRA